MTQLRHCQREPASCGGDSAGRLTILPPPPPFPVPDPRAPRERAFVIPDFSLAEGGFPEPDVQELREPTDVDCTRWWDDEDDEDAAITERPPRLQETH